MAKSTIRIQFLGASFTIQSDEDQEYMNRVLSYFKENVDKIQRTLNVKDPLKSSILSGLFITDELFKERERTRDRLKFNIEEYSEAGEIAHRIIKRIDESL
ncbi:MAG: cell division protein ZapA [Spirochaetes bacterium]|nr:MAG: cell division protein ZapA [Spirochaetota bacterium]